MTFTTFDYSLSIKLLSPSSSNYILMGLDSGVAYVEAYFGGALLTSSVSVDSSVEHTLSLYVEANQLTLTVDGVALASLTATCTKDFYEMQMGVGVPDPRISQVEVSVC